MKVWEASSAPVNGAAANHCMLFLTKICIAQPENEICQPVGLAPAGLSSKDGLLMRFGRRGAGAAIASGASTLAPAIPTKATAIPPMPPSNARRLIEVRIGA